MTTKRTEESEHWINTQLEWILPIKDTDNKALPKGNGSTPRNHKARRFEITNMTPAFKGKPSVITVKYKRNDKKYAILTRTMIKDNYDKCKLFFIKNHINKQWYKKLKVYKEAKFRSGYEELKEYYALSIECECNDYEMGNNSDDNLEEAEQMGILDRNMPDLPLKMSKAELEDKIAHMRDMVQEEEEEWMDGYFWSDDE